MKLIEFKVTPPTDNQPDFQATAVFREKNVPHPRNTGMPPIVSALLTFTFSSTNLGDVTKWLDQLKVLVADGVSTKVEWDRELDT